MCKSEECGASKHQDQIITVSAAAENGLDCSREGVSSNHQPIFHIHRLCGPPDRGRRRPSKVSSRGAPLWGKIGFRTSERKFQSTPAPKEISEISRGNEEERREISVRLDPEEAPAASRWLLEGPACSFGREERPGIPSGK